MVRYFLISFLIVAAFIFGFLFFSQKNTSVYRLEVPEAKPPKTIVYVDEKDKDIPPQKPLKNPPKEIRALYLTSWSAGNKKKISEIIKLLKKANLNALVIDIKDYSGYVFYNIENELVDKYQTKKIAILKINSLIKKLHDENIYLIGRIVVFQDPVLAKKRPDLAVHSLKKLKEKNKFSNSTAINFNYSLNTLWQDNKGLSWLDPAAKEVWQYNLLIAKDAFSRGFDEINFDYIRFPSDGNLADMYFPHWSKKKKKSEIIAEFFKFISKELKNHKISADLFGLAAVNYDDLGIGQKIEDAFGYFDFIAPMIYPSHYASGFLNFKNPAQHPYEVINYSMKSAFLRLKKFNQLKNSTTTLNYLRKTKLRPWLQSFDLGAKYNKEMIEKQIKAVYDAASSTGSLNLLNGYMFWDPKNSYQSLIK